MTDSRSHTTLFRDLETFVIPVMTRLGNQSVPMQQFVFANLLFQVITVWFGPLVNCLDYVCVCYFAVLYLFMQWKSKRWQCLTPYMIFLAFITIVIAFMPPFK